MPSSDNRRSVAQDACERLGCAATARRALRIALDALRESHADMLCSDADEKTMKLVREALSATAKATDAAFRHEDRVNRIAWAAMAAVPS